ncbi:MAG: AMP-binding protein [Acidisphaera sp.]|nr:AMP-binding protein [Acidisphaera sp.]
MAASTIREILTGSTPGRAIGAPGRSWLDTPDLRDRALSVAARLNAAGIGPGDRVGMVLKNGPEMATAFLSVTATATAAPLNPAYRAEEFAFYLGDLKPKALIIEAGDETPARAVAAGLDIPVISLQPLADAPAGSFSLDTGALPSVPAGQGGPAGPEDVALVLHTSGTTARPKIVPLSNANLAASARHIAGTLALGPGDVCLNIMPLFHIHGLLAAVLASLSAGAAVCCTPGFNALRFFTWLEEVKPTWYTAVPTMHQAILMRARSHREQARAAGLRFIRSSSASLPPQVMAELEEVFDAPVIEAYGMTEASHQMASNPLPPRPRKPGHVGLAAGPEIAIMDDDGGLLPAGGIGEVVIRGPNVTRGYDNNPEANARAFTNGWFRTGDQGVLDAEGYLSLTGRLKELINRGGEKVSPLEIDTVIMDHPAVAQVVTFGMPHDKLGEEVAAAVVLREGAAADEPAIRDFCAQRLAPFKVPRRVVFLAEIPKGATGKLQRIGLAQKLGLGG